MATSCAEDNGEATWELSKENVQPVKSGRDVNCIAAVLQPSREDMERLMREKQIFEEEIITGENSEDPIKAWDRYLKWTIQNFPSGRNDQTLLKLLRKFIEKFHAEKYKNDIRHVQAWLKLAEIMKDPFETFSYMYSEGIGTECAELYIAWADEYEKYGDIKRADKIYNDGDEKCALPRELLQKRHMEFQLRVARGMLNKKSQPSDDDDEPGPHQRKALNPLKGRGKHLTVGTQRRGRALPLQSLQTPGSLGGRSASNAAQNPERFQIYEDEPVGVTVMGESGKWASAPSTGSVKENTLNPGQWKGVKVKQKYVRSERMSSLPAQPVSEFTVYEDDCQSAGFSNEPHKIATNIESVLSEKKETIFNFSNIRSAIDEMPVHEGNINSGYDLDKIYTVMGEMQFEEVRAAHWRKRQKVQAEQAAIIRQQELEEERLHQARLVREQEQKVYDERRRLDAERLKLLEQERKWIEVERMQMQQKRSQLENRLKEIKILEKTAITVEQERLLHEEEEDVTIQLNAMRRNIRRVSMKLSNDGESASMPVSQMTNDFVIYNENENPQQREVQEIESEMRPHQQMSNSLKLTSANNSLNHSKRSQPSPTVNTKEAMHEIDAWFQKPLEDAAFPTTAPDCQNEYVTMPQQEPAYSFKPIDEPQSSHHESNDPFQIFTEEDETASARRPSTTSISKKRGLSARTIDAPEESTHVVAVGTKALDSHCQDEDRSKYCFDDVTVAGSHFAAKAHLASTPFCSKTEKFQDMTQLNHLSRIQPEMTENLSLYGKPSGQPEPCTPYILPTQAEEEHDLSQPGIPLAQAEEESAQSQPESEMLHTLEKEDDPSGCNEVKKLSAIMEASNESDKSSVNSTTKSSQAHSEPDESQHLSGNMPLHPEPLKVTSLDGAAFPWPPDHFSSNGSIDCNLWDDTEDRTVPEKERALAKRSKHVDKDISQRQPVAIATSNFETENDITKQQKQLDDISSNLHTTSISREKEVLSSIENRSTLPNVIPDPWNDVLLNTIMKRRGSLDSNNDIAIFYENHTTVPKLKKGCQLKFGNINLSIGQMVAEGAYAKVFDVVSNDSKCSQVVKAQFPPCPWEVYAVSQAKHRLVKNDMKEIAKAIIDINSAFFFKDGSLLFMPPMNKGTLLDLINAKKDTEKMKNTVAMWIAYQVMKTVHGLHTVGFIHGDIKPDNFMIVPEDAQDLSKSCCEVGGIKLIDFGQAIDMSEMPKGAAFTRCCPTSAFTCIQMRNGEPWNYHIDFYGIAGTLHVVLFGSYMTARLGKDGVWEITNKIKRWCNVPLWRDFFHTLLNFPTPTRDRPITFADSPLPRLITEIKSLLEQSQEMDSVANFLRR